MGVDSRRVEADSSAVSTPETPFNLTLSIGPVLLQPLEIHRVCLPPQKTTFQKLKHRLSEIFFPDDPFHRFKNQTFLRKVVLGLHCLFPILQWVPSYSLSTFRSDLVSGLTIASLAIPQGISYAKLANLPPIIGLYSSFVPPLIYSLLGSSKHLGVGPVSIASLVMGTMLSETVSSTHESDLYLRLAFTATFFAGLFQASLGLFSDTGWFHGWSSSYCVLAAAKRIAWIVHFTKKMQIIPVMSSVFGHTKEWSWKTIVLGFGFLIFLLTARLTSLKRPKLFWISAAAPLTSVILSTLLVYLLKSELHGVSVIGELPDGLNPPSANILYFHGPHLGLAIKAGIVTGILSLTEGIAVGRTFASLQNYQVDGNKEMMAIGSFSRSAVNYNAGAKTAFSNIVMAGAVLVTLLFLMPLFYHTPNLVLAAIIITAVIGLIDYNAAFLLWKLDKLEFLACLCSFFGVLFISVPMGYIIHQTKKLKQQLWPLELHDMVGVSVFKILLHVTRPNTVALGNIPGIESPIYFANSTYLQERILRWVWEEEERLKEKEENLKCVVLDMTAVTAIDSSGIDAIYELRKTLLNRSVQLVLVNPVGSVMEKLHHSKILDLFGTNQLYLTVGEAVTDISSSWKA
ncbi:putative sulfate transporter 3.4 [Vitis vinifera]|uniref:Putative sulfate transporter 3.4 n=1 Tax=Vitis vinifera TaxID=29760 RepID=A0A438EIP8_VITVI|nr:putative sulfate transporter 3.4 [Vitis vinifera]